MYLDVIFYLSRHICQQRIEKEGVNEMRNAGINYIPVGRVKPRNSRASLRRKIARFLYDAMWLVFEAMEPVIDAMMLIMAGVLFGAGFYLGRILISLCRL